MEYRTKNKEMDLESHVESYQPLQFIGRFKRPICTTLAALTLAYSTAGCATGLMPYVELKSTPSGEVQTMVGFKTSETTYKDKQGDEYIIEKKKNWWGRNWKWVTALAGGLAAGYCAYDIINKHDKGDSASPPPPTPTTTKSNGGSSPESSDSGTSYQSTPAQPAPDNGGSAPPSNGGSTPPPATEEPVVEEENP